jgi:hypothetical protein
MADASDLESVGIGADKEEAVVSYAQPKLFVTPQGLHVTSARLRKTMQDGKNMHGGGFAQAADI